MKNHHRKHINQERCFSDACIYYKNAKEFLKKSEIEYSIYKDKKLVREASGIGYLAVLEAINGFLLKCGIDTDKLPKSYNAILDFLHKYSRQNGKVIAAYVTVYEILHISGYYRGTVDVDTVKSGFEKAKFIIETLTEKKL